MRFKEDLIFNYDYDYSEFISSLDRYGIVGFTMFDGEEENGTGTVIGPNK